MRYYFSEFWGKTCVTHACSSPLINKHQDRIGWAKDVFEEKPMKGGKDRSSSSKQVEFLDQFQVWQLIIEGDKREGWLNRRSCRVQYNSEKFSTRLDGKSQSKEYIFENSFVRQKQCSLFSAMQNCCLGAAQGEIYPVCEYCDGFKILAAGVSKPIHWSQCISLEGRSEQQTSMTATLGMKIAERLWKIVVVENESWLNKHNNGFYDW